MRHLKTVLLMLPFLFFWIPSASGATQKHVLLESVTFHQISGQEESVSFALTGKNTRKIFMLSGDNPRIVVDFINTGCSARIDRTMDIKGKLVKGIRVGIHTSQPPKTRVVIDLIPGGTYHYTKHFNPQDNTLLLVVSHKKKKIAATKVMQHKVELKKTPVKRHIPVAQQKPEPAKQVAAKPEEKEMQTQKHATKETPVTKPVRLKKKEHKEVLSPSKGTRAGKENAKGQPSGGKQMEKEAVPGKTKLEGQAANKAVGAAKPKSGKKTGEIQSKAKKPKSLLSSVSFENDSTKGEMVLFKVTNFSPPNVFGIEKGEPKVIVDFADTDLGKQIKKNISCHGRYVQSIEVAKQEKSGAVRVVLHLTSHRNYDLQQVFFKDDNLFVIIVNSEKPLLEENTPKRSK